MSEELKRRAAKWSTRAIRGVLDPIFEEHPFWQTNPESERALRLKATLSLSEHVGRDAPSIPAIIDREMLRRLLLQVRSSRPAIPRLEAWLCKGRDVGISHDDCKGASAGWEVDLRGEAKVCVNGASLDYSGLEETIHKALDEYDAAARLLR